MEERRSVQKDIAEIMTFQNEFLAVREDLEALKSDVAYFRTVMSKVMVERRSVQKDIAEIRMALQNEFLAVREDLEALKSDVAYFRTVMSKVMVERRSVQKDIAEIRMALQNEFLSVCEYFEALKSDVAYFRTAMSKSMDNLGKISDTLDHHTHKENKKSHHQFVCSVLGYLVPSVSEYWCKNVLSFIL